MLSVVIFIQTLQANAGENPKLDLTRNPSTASQFIIH
jgi:hypothetical protein